MKILVVDDEKLLVKGIKFNLQNEGYQVECAYDGAAAVELARTGNFDLIILDLMMPEIDGLEACMRIREFSNVPIIMLTARSQEFDELMGFEAGADDYVTKPCSPSVLMKRVAALLRRDTSANDSKVVSVDDLKLDNFAHEVWLGGSSVMLTVKEYSILQKLLSSPGRVFTREQLLDDIWGYDFTGDIRTVDSHVARLRTKLGEWGSKHIKTIYGTGYKLEVKENEG